jgi:hypothetical protein
MIGRFRAAAPAQPQRRVRIDETTRIGHLHGEASEEPYRRPPGSAYFEATGGILLESVATSPELLARALVQLLGANTAADLLSNALNCISGTMAPREGGDPDVKLLTRSAHDDNTTENSAFAEEEDLSREQLQIIKARTMFNMVEEIDDGKSKLLFLTNPQAELIASSSESVQKMLDALEVPKPSLVIEFLETWGFRGSTNLFYRLYYDDLTEGTAGMRHGVPPFLNSDDEAEAEAKIDMSGNKNLFNESPQSPSKLILVLDPFFPQPSWLI